MPPVSVLIKPASSACNMNCSYCFYRDEAQNRQEYFSGMMSEKCACELIKKALDFAEKSCYFMFQGGEPTLRGLDFFKDFVAAQKKYAKPDVQIFNSIQTNGMLIDEQWASFLAENNFLTGLSLDGTALIHNAVRFDKNGQGTFDKVMSAARELKKAGAEFNILCVVTNKTAKNTQKIYSFMKANGFYNIQFIPCLNPIGQKEKTGVTSLSVLAYTEFLVKIFNLWFADLKRGEYISIRHIDNFVGIALGHQPENCGMRGRCGIQFVTEGNGNVYPCDFYVLDEYILGNVLTDSFTQLINTDNARRFIENSLNIPAVCKNCKFFSFCRCGCTRERTAPDGRNRFCESYKEFFSRCSKNIFMAADIIRNNYVNTTNNAVK